jgi:drug/metabolite transporter (DMT)-like permease
MSRISLALRSWLPRPQIAALVCITMVWGTTFLIVHAAMARSGPLFFVGLRFSVAGLLTLALFRKSMRRVTWLEVRAGILIGLSLWLGYSLNTFGLQSITASQSAFITALYVPIVPLLQWIVLRNTPHPMAWVGIALAFAGLVCLTSPDPSMTQGAVGVGDVLTLLGAVAIAMEIILIGKFAHYVDSRRVTVIQLLTAGALSFTVMPAAGESVPEFSWVWLCAAVGLGLASALIQLTMNWAQKSVSPTKATLIYAGEPIWAGVFGRMAGERLPTLAFVGAALVVFGVVAGELRLRWWSKPMQSIE